MAKRKIPHTVLFIQRHPKSGRNLKMEDADKTGMKDFAYDSLIDASVPVAGAGIKQANRAGGFLYGLLKKYPLRGPMMLFSTPHVRGRQGLEIEIPYLERAGVELLPSGQPESPLYQQDARLSERSFGDWDGMTPAQIENYYKTKSDLLAKIHKGKLKRKEIEFLQEEAVRPYKMFMDNKNDVNTGGFYAKPPNGEDPFSVALRLRDLGGTIARQRSDHGISRFFVETHGEVCKILPITFMKKAPYENYAREKKPGNTAIRMITSDPDGDGYIDHGYIYDPESGVNILKKNHIPNLQKYLY